jgi:hypothetical protein
MSCSEKLSSQGIEVLFQDFCRILESREVTKYPAWPQPTKVLLLRSLNCLELGLHYRDGRNSNQPISEKLFYFQELTRRNH